MPYSIFQKLALSELRPTKMTLKLADLSVCHPMGKDVLFKMDRFIFPVDFVILDLDDKAEASLILRCPFLATSQAFIDVNDDILVLRVGDDEVVFTLIDAMCTL